jgi:hypothetical protein
VKRKDIKAGVVYAEPRSYGPPTAVVFLEDGAATVWQRVERYSGPDEVRALAADAKPQKGSGWRGRSQGYATVRGDAELLAGLDVAAELERFKADSQPSRDGLWFTLAFQLGKVAGPYADEVAAYKAREDAKRKADDDAKNRRLAARKRVDDVREALGEEAGIASQYVQDSYGKHGIWVSVEDAERLLTLLRAER